MDTIRYGVIGLRGVGRVHCETAFDHDRIALAAVADTDDTALEKTVQKYNLKGFTDYRELLDLGLVDAVSLALPHHLHAPVALDCLQAGVHVFVEKPIARRVSEADEMIRVANERDLVLGVRHQYRTFRANQIVKGLIDRGEIGDIMRVLWSWVDFRPESYYNGTGWHASWEKAGGGLLISQFIHDLDLLCWLVGRPVRVSAMVANQLHDVEVEDIVSASMAFENGAMATVEATNSQPRGHSVRQICGTHGTIVMPDVASLIYDRRDEILLGTYDPPVSKAATIFENHLRQPDIQWRDVSVPDRSFWTKVLQKLRLKERKQHSLSPVFDEFIDAVLNGKEPLVTAESARQSLEVMNAIILSALRGRVVELPVDREEYDHLYDELVDSRTRVPTFR